MEKVYDYDHATGKSELRNPTAEEVSDMEKTAAAKVIELQKEEAQRATKASAIAKLAALGLTEDEAKAIIG